MRIYNVNSKTSAKTQYTMLAASVLITLVFIGVYLCTSENTYSLSDFYNWYVQAFNIFSKTCNGSDEKLYPIIIFAILPIGSYLGAIWAFVARKIALNKFNLGLNVKYMEFLQDIIKFNFNKKDYNITCRYSDINAFEVIIHTILVHTKNGTYSAVQEVELKYTICNNKTISLSNTPTNVMKFIYSVIDLHRPIENFTYSFVGAGEPSGMREKIDDYKTKGLKQILSKQEEASFKIMSVLFFILAIFLMSVFSDMFDDTIKDGPWFVLIPSVVFIGISFIFDFYLMADKIREMRFYGKLGTNK